MKREKENKNRGLSLIRSIDIPNPNYYVKNSIKEMKLNLKDLPEGCLHIERWPNWARWSASAPGWCPG
jgi:hypothetical protein